MELNDRYVASIKYPLRRQVSREKLLSFCALTGKTPAYNRMYSSFGAIDRKQIKFFDQP